MASLSHHNFLPLEFYAANMHPARLYTRLAVVGVENDVGATGAVGEQGVVAGAQEAVSAT